VIVIWGTRNGGKVDRREGQYALTRFAHVYYLPLFPVSSMWVTRAGVGHAMKMSGKSVIAGYTRTWGLVLGLVGLAGIGGSVGFGAAVGGVVAAALSWAWKDVATDAAKRRSDLNLLAYGTRCEPKQLPPELADALKGEVTRRWAEISDGQSPGDVARFGTDDVQRAATAYGVLRLSALGLPAAQAAEAERDAARIADGVREKLQLTEGGPYRSAAIDDRLQPEKPPKR
jgi:hypothetical protein